MAQKVSSFRSCRGFSSCFRVLCDTLRTVPFFSLVGCATLLFLFHTLRVGLDEVWTISSAAGMDTTTIRSAFDIALLVLAGLDVCVLVLIVITSGRLLELIVRRTHRDPSTWAPTCGGWWLMGILGVAYAATLMAVCALMALDVITAAAMVTILHASAACETLDRRALVKLFDQVGEDLAQRIPGVPAFSIAPDDVASVCAALREGPNGSLVVLVVLGFIAVVIQLMYSTSVFSRMWALRSEGKVARVERDAKRVSALVFGSNASVVVGMDAKEHELFKDAIEQKPLFTPIDTEL